MMATKQKYDKLGGNVAYHGYQSFREGEVTPDEAHKIGLKTAKRMWGDYEVVVTTHINGSSCIHNHFVVNSVSFKNGRKFENHIRDHFKLREISDELCRQYDKSVLEHSSFFKSEGNAYWYRKNGGLTKMDKFREDADIARSYARDFYDYYNNLIYLGYKFYSPRYTKYEYVIVPGFKNPVKLSSLGTEYTFYGFKPRETKEFVRHHIIHIYTKRYPNRTMWDSLFSLWQTILDFIEYLINENRNNGKTNIPLSPELRAEFRDFEKIHREYTFITDNKVYTEEDLKIYISQKQEQIDDLSAERQHIYDLCRRPKSDEELEENKAKAREISKAIRLIRADLKLAKTLPERQSKLFGALQQEYLKEYPNRQIKRTYERN